MAEGDQFPIQRFAAVAASQKVIGHNYEIKVYIYKLSKSFPMINLKHSWFLRVVITHSFIAVEASVDNCGH